MQAIFRYAMRGSRGSILGWGLAVFAISLLTMVTYDTVYQNAAPLKQMIENLPAGFKMFVGDNADKIAEPSGYLEVKYFAFMPVILGVFALLAGSGMIVADEERGRLDLLLSYPVSRTTLFWGRLLATLLSLVLIVGLGWLGLVAGLPTSPVPISLGSLLLPFAGLLVVLTFAMSLALVLSLLLPARRLAALIVGLLLVGSFVVEGLAKTNSSLEWIAALLPLHYYQGASALDGLQWPPLAGMAAVSAALICSAWWLFERRDIRVAGEGAFSWRRRAAAQPAGA